MADPRTTPRKPGDVISDTNHVRNYEQVDGKTDALLSVMVPSGGADELNALVESVGLEGDSARRFREGEVSIGVFPIDPLHRMMMKAMGALPPSIQLTRDQVQDLHDTLGAILGAWPCTLPCVPGVVAYTEDSPDGIGLPE